MKKDSKIYVAGHNGLVGSALMRTLKEEGYTNIITAEFKYLNLINQVETEKFFAENKPEYVFLIAAKVGGIVGNSKFPADYIYENLQIESNVIFNSHKFKVKKLLFMGSSCIYPKLCPQPIKEEYLLTGPLEESNVAYAVAKISGLMMCRKFKEQYRDNFISVMPTNLYGPNDNFHPEYSHVIPALIRRFVEAKRENKKEVVVWGTGNPKREFLYVDDLAEALIFLMNNYDGVDHINIGMGMDISIKELAETLKEVVGFEGQLKFDITKPDGTPRKLLDINRISKLGWRANVELKEGLRRTVAWFQNSF